MADIQAGKVLWYIPYIEKHWHDKTIFEFSNINFLEEKSVANDLIMENGY